MDYKQYANLPLLTGISAQQLHHFHERGALRLVNIEPEEGYIIRQGGHCNSLTMLTQGTLMCHTQGNGWTLEEEIHAPAIIEEEALWSLDQTYLHTYRPLTPGQVIISERRAVIQSLMSNEIFRLNLLMRLSSRLSRSQKASQWQSHPTLRQQIYAFIRSIQSTDTYPKILHIKMKTLSDIVRQTRLNVSRELNQMSREGLIGLRREHISIYK